MLVGSGSFVSASIDCTDSDERIPSMRLWQAGQKQDPPLISQLLESALHETNTKTPSRENHGLFSTFRIATVREFTLQR